MGLQIQEIVYTCMYDTNAYICTYVRHNSSAGMY